MGKAHHEKYRILDDLHLNQLSNRVVEMKIVQDVTPVTVSFSHATITDSSCRHTLACMYILYIMHVRHPAF